MTHTNTNTNTPQTESALSSIAEQSAFHEDSTNAKDFTSAPPIPAKPVKFPPRQQLILQALLPGHWVERVELDRIGRTTNAPDAIKRIRDKLGYAAIETAMRTIPAPFGGKTQVGRYRLTEAGHASIARMGGLPCSNA